MFNLFKNILNHKKEVTVNLDRNVQLVVTPAVAGGAHAAIIETTGMFIRKESCYFDSLNSLVNSLHLTDNEIVRKLSKAF